MGTKKGTIENVYEDLRKFYSDEYKKATNLESIENKATREYLAKFDLDYWSHKNRLIRNIQSLKHTFIIPKTNMITTCFKVTLDSTSCIYGYLHSEWCHLGDSRDKRQKGKIRHLFVATGPTYRSMDGEYRSRMIPYDQFVKVFVKYEKEFSMIESTILDKIDSKRLEFQTDFYYPNEFNYSERNFEDNINSLRLPIKLYILCWAFDYYQIYMKTIENHANPAYQYIIYQQDDLPTFEKLLKKMGRRKYWEMLSRIANYYDDIDSPDVNINEIQCGQKIFPMTVFEAIRRDDINFSVWREIYITNMASNLVLNLISPSFPFVNNWFYIQNVHSGLFDNVSMHDKYLHSSIASDISIQLKNIDKLNYVNRDRKKGAISNKFLRLSRNMQKSIVYADSDIRLTELAICLTTEYVGRTLRDTPALIVNKEFLPGLDLVFTDINIFTKHMFEFVYAFYCMNTKIGIMHGDLHMNNATIARLYLMMTDDGELYLKKFPHIAFILDQTVYVFPHYGLFSTIIDFSRAIIGDYKKLEHEFSPRFAELYFKEQRLRVMRMIYHYFPKLMDKYMDKIESLLISNFPLMFKILTAIDTYVIMSNIAAMFAIDDAFTRKQIKIAPGAIRLLAKLADMAEHLVNTNMQAALDGRITVPDDIPWPNHVILTKNFEEFKLTPDKMQNPDINIVEIFNSNNEIINDTEDYDSWGPLLSIDKEIELRKKYNQEIDKGIKQWISYRQTDDAEFVEALTTKYEQQEKEVLQFEPWMLV
ncbi:hypothetical protein PV-S19_0152 [Pacmanvirus S19]|nr:hypothetical protein PV-S19_0152 [Pacmanvirus S19]